MADSYPSYGGPSASRNVRPVQAGVASGSDPTNEPGQYPPADTHGIFGGQLPSGTGAPGSAGGRAPADPTIEAGQLSDTMTGVPDSGITGTGAPGSQGSEPGSGGGSAVTFTRPTAGYAANETVTVNDETSGPKDWTQANDDGYATGGPQLPGLAGNEPQAGQGRFQPGGGTVLRGGRAVRG